MINFKKFQKLQLVIECYRIKIQDTALSGDPGPPVLLLRIVFQPTSVTFNGADDR
jgi:hypothetical protein